MESAQVYVQEWITETINRNLYDGADIALRLRGVQELLGDGDREDQIFLRKFLSGIDEHKLSYSAQWLQDNLLDLWGCITREMNARVTIDA